MCSGEEDAGAKKEEMEEEEGGSDAAATPRCWSPEVMSLLLLDAGRRAWTPCLMAHRIEMQSLSLPEGRCKQGSGFGSWGLGARVE